MKEPEEALSKLRPGTMVGEYQVTHLLGEGGMGVVYAGTHPEIGKRVAIKVLAPHAAQHPDLIRRFKEEARAVNKIRHPNIIDIFAFNQLRDGRHYFVMEYLDGECLTARLKRGSMEFAEMRRLLSQICSALEGAHEAGVVHRDLKPDNIWVAKQHLTESRIKLLDFGIAKLNDLTNSGATQSGVSLGTPQYMAPEQAMGRPVDQRADVYALGVVLYQIFAGKLPFEGVTTHEIVFKHVSEAPLPPSTHRPIVPPQMEQIILDCLEKAPERRPPSMAVLSQRIEAAFAAQGDTYAAGGTKLIPRLPALAQSSVPAPGRTELLPESGRVRGSVIAQPPSPTTLRGSTGERVAADGEPSAAKRKVAGSRVGRPLTIGVGVMGLLAIAVGFGVRGRRTSETQVSPTAPASSTAPAGGAAPPAPILPLPPVEKLAVAPSPAPAPAPAPAEAPPPQKSPGGAAPAETSPQVASHKHEHKRPLASAAPPPSAHAAVPAAAKPDCNPNYYFDAQARKHFKPECF